MTSTKGQKKLLYEVSIIRPLIRLKMNGFGDEEPLTNSMEKNNLFIPTI